MKVGLSSIEYTKYKDKPIVHLFGRDSNRERHHVRVYNLFPFFYVDRITPVPKNNKIIKIENVSKNGWKSIKDTEIKKIIMKLPEDVGGNRRDKKGFRYRFTNTYEDDIEFVTRAAIELGIKSGFSYTNADSDFGSNEVKSVDFKAELKRLHIDIEVSTTETSGRFPNYEHPVNPIYSLANFDSYSEKFVIFIWHPKYKNDKRYSSKFVVPIFKSMKKMIKSKKEYIDNFINNRDNIILTCSTDEDGDFNKEIGINHFNITLKKHKYELKNLKTQLKTLKKQFNNEYPLSIYTFNNEKDMLRKWMKYFIYMDSDIPTGWNFKKFDAPYIIARSRRLRLDIAKISPLNSVYIDNYGQGRIKGRIVFDTWSGYKKTLTSAAESTKLDVVSKKLFGIGKVKHSGIDEMWENNRDLLIKYNVQDVFLEYAIGVNQGVFDFFYDVKCYSGCTYEDVLNNSRIVDAFMLFKAKERKIVLPSKRDREGKKYAGAVVLQAPSVGVKRWIVVLDLKSLYPMCMITLNMGEDTITINPPEEQIDKLIKSPLKSIYFRKDKESFVVSILRELLDYRDKLKANMDHLNTIGEFGQAELVDRIQTVVKFITNSIYGVMGYNKFRLYNRHIASNITAAGRMVINYTIKVCNKLGYDVYYGDTDSVFVLIHARDTEAIQKEIFKLADKLNKSYDVFLKAFNVDKHFFLMKAEKVFKTMFMVRLKHGKRAAKKRYAGNIVWDDKKGEVDRLGITGFDRSDMSRVGNKIMKNILEMACYDKSNDEITKYLKDEIFKIKNMEYPLEDIAFSKGISKALNTYGNQDWIRAARWTNQHSSLWGKQTNYGGGSKPKYVYMLQDKIPAPYARTNIAALDDDFFFPPHLSEVIDFNTLIEKTVKLKVETILEALGLNWTEITSKMKVKGLLS